MLDTCCWDVVIAAQGVHDTMVLVGSSCQDWIVSTGVGMVAIVCNCCISSGFFLSGLDSVYRRGNGCNCL